MAYLGGTLIILLGACGKAVMGGAVPGDPVYTMEPARVDGETLVVEGVASNAGEQTIQYEMLSPCPTTLRIYRMLGTGTAETAWDQLAWHNSRPGGCKRSPVTLTLAPGETRFVGGVAEVADILGDSLPAGPYEVAIVIWGGFTSPPPMEVDVGEVILER